jgi:hypothetical protein
MGLSEKFADRLPIPEPAWEREPELLLHPNVPMPLHGLAPRVVFGAKWWNKERRKAYAATEDHCKACGVHKLKAKGRKWVEAHENYAIDYDKGMMTYCRSVALCHFCHSYIHDGRLRSLLAQGKLAHGVYVAIIQHGDDVLARAELPKRSTVSFTQAENCVVPWASWRLIIGRRKFAPLYGSLEEYLAVTGHTIPEG